MTLQVMLASPGLQRLETIPSQLRRRLLGRGSVAKGIGKEGKGPKRRRDRLGSFPTFARFNPRLPPAEQALPKGIERRQDPPSPLGEVRQILETVAKEIQTHNQSQDRKYVPLQRCGQPAGNT